MQYVRTDFEAFDVRDHAGKRAEPGDVIVAFLSSRFRSVLPADNMDQHLENILHAYFAISHAQAHLCVLASLREEPDAIISTVVATRSYTTHHDPLPQRR